MVEKVAATNTVAVNGGLLTAVKVGLFLFAMVRLACVIFGAWWAALSRPMIKGLLQTAQLANIEVTVNYILGTAIFPLIMSVLVVLAPLFGWWIYSRVDGQKQNMVGWTSAVVFAIGDAALTFVFSASQIALGYHIDIFGMIVGEVIVILWIMFFMGLGFNIAKLFKAKL